jgi:hypothetical protein
MKFWRVGPIPWQAIAPQITSQDIPSKSWQCGWVSCMNRQCGCFCDSPDAGKHMAWNRVPFEHSASNKWCSHWDALNLLNRSSN